MRKYLQLGFLKKSGNEVILKIQKKFPESHKISPIFLKPCFHQSKVQVDVPTAKFSDVGTQLWCFLNFAKNGQHADNFTFTNVKFDFRISLSNLSTYFHFPKTLPSIANEIAKAYEEFYGVSNNKHLPPPFVANPTSTIIAGSSLETEETDSQDSNVNQQKFNPDRIYSVQSSQEFSVKSVETKIESSSRNSKSFKNVDRNGSDKRSRRSDLPSYKKQEVSQQGSTVGNLKNVCK